MAGSGPRARPPRISARSPWQLSLPPSPSLSADPRDGSPAAVPLSAWAPRSGERARRKPAAEDWDFVGQLTRHPHLARKDPVLSSRASRRSRCGRARDGSPRPGSSRPLSLSAAAALLPPRLRGSPKRRLPKETPAPPARGPRPEPARRGSPDARSACGGFQAAPGWLPRRRGQGTRLGRCGDLACPSPAEHRLHQDLRDDPTPYLRGPDPRGRGHLRSDPRGTGPGRGESLRAGPCAPTLREPRAPLDLPGPRGPSPPLPQDA